MQGLKDRDAGMRIIAATGLDGSSVNPKQLSYDLKLTWDLLRSEEQLTPPASRQMLRELTLFARAARLLKLRLTSLGPRARLELKPRLTQNYALEGEFADLLKELIQDAEARIDRATRGSDGGRDSYSTGPGSIFERFVGVELAEIYTKHFGLDPRVRRDVKRRPAGPFISFCLAAFGELNIQNNGRSYSAGAIGRALTSAKTNKLRSPLGKHERD